MGERTALLLGATGLTGQACLQLLLECSAYNKVITITRRPLYMREPKHRNIVIDFSDIENTFPVCKPDDVYCTLGTTMAQARSREKFYETDFHIPLRIARVTLQQGAKRFILCSATGASPRSMFFYNRVKGELEQSLQQLPFEAIHIFRPSLLLGKRTEKRTGERVAQLLLPKVSFLLKGPLKRYRGTPVSELAQKMVSAGISDLSGIHIYENERIIHYDNN
ncbi:MAG: NAD-dependent epimerase/dehydratase family protein [Chitinophagales bacterium]|nr:NAD-dependent epimerase/dehydratase family protein [Chitinophagales bacterium]MDW8418107.1 NAD-dependent epimerase/dehydratase family protein [Chitinophagales bacterium]